MGPSTNLLILTEAVSCLQSSMAQVQFAVLAVLVSVTSFLQLMVVVVATMTGFVHYFHEKVLATKSCGVPGAIDGCPARFLLE